MAGSGTAGSGAVAPRVRRSFRDRLDQLRDSTPALLLGGLTAAVAWLVARQFFDETDGLFAPLAAVLTLGLAAGERGRRALGVAVGVALGLGIADLVVAVIGDGVWQLGVVIVLARAAAILADGSPLAINQATVSAVLVVTLHTSDVFPDRFVDALIGAAFALGANALARRW
jgi:uncharacterized membrane protein YgaE (UPF0421/DUF939 family)